MTCRLRPRHSTIPSPATCSRALLLPGHTHTTATCSVTTFKSAIHTRQHTLSDETIRVRTLGTQNNQEKKQSVAVSMQLVVWLLLLLLLLDPLNGLFWVSRYQKCKTSLDLNEARHDGVLGCSGISWTICKQSAPHSRQIITPTPHSSLNFYRPDALPDAQPTLSKH